jgi:signal transduction histidine kinase
LGVVFVTLSSAYAENANSSIDLLPYMDHLIENCAETGMSLKDVQALNQSSYNNISKSNLKKNTFGYTPCEHWFHWKLSALPQPAGKWWLQISPTFLDSVVVYAVQADGRVDELRMGDHIPHVQRAVPARHFLIPLDLISSDTEYYVSVRTSSTLTLTLTLRKPEAYVNYASRENMFYGVLFGLSIAVMVICFIGGAWFREPFYFVMAAFVFCNALSHFILNGFDQFLIYPESSDWPDRMLTFSVFAAGVAGVSLYLVFLQPKAFYPRLTLACWTGAGVAALAAIASLLGHPSPVFSGFMSILLLALLLALSLLMIRHHFVQAMLMLVLFLPQLFTICLQVARNFALLPMTFWTTHTWAIVSMLQIPFVALVVMMRVRDEEKAFLIEKEKTRLDRDLFSMVAHELRTPLAVVSSALANIELQTMNSHAELSPRFARANLGLARLNALIDNALAEDRLAAEGIQLQLQWIDIADLIKELCDLRAIEPPHYLRMTLPTEPLSVYVDTHWLGPALLSLLDNAVKYSPAGGEIHIIVEQENNMASIHIIDQGIGIPPEATDKIFERFFRADNARKLQGSSGMGVGLFLVQSILSLHGGELEYQPNPSGGSIFTCSLPLSL